MSRQQTSQEMCERKMEGTELKLRAYQKSLIKNSFAQMLLGLLLLGMGMMLLIKILAENTGHFLLYSAIFSFLTGAMTMSAGGAAMLVTRSMCSPALPASAKNLIFLHVCLSMVSIPISLANAAFSSKPTIDCLRAMEDCYPDAVKKGAWSLANLVLLIVLLLLNCHACGLFGKYGDFLGFSPRLAVLCRARRSSARDAEASVMQQQQGTAIPQRDVKNWQPPSYEEAINMCYEGGRAILPGVHSSCQVGSEDEPPKYEDIVAREGWRK